MWESAERFPNRLRSDSTCWLGVEAKQTTRPSSNDLRERVAGAVERGELSCRQAAAHYGVGISTAIKWVQRLRRTDSVSPGKIGGYRPKKLIGP